MKKFLYAIFLAAGLLVGCANNNINTGMPKLTADNAILIKQGKNQAERMQLLHELAVQPMTTLSSLNLSNLPGIDKK